jgi:hypothetical protein
MVEEIITSSLTQFGILGVWTISLLYERYKQGAKTNLVIENNTIAMTKVYEVIQKCQTRK